ncbi:8429_t:CDS:1, partial [Scutellospora calospora]
NIFCGAIIDERTVFCVCGQKIVLDNDYDESRLIEHSKNSRCKLNNKKKQLGLPGLFPVLPNSKKRKENPPLSSYPPSSSLPLSPSLPPFPNKPCPGLHSEQISSYINRTPSTYGGARRREVIGKEMFPNKFSNNMNFNSKKLNEEEIIQFNQQVMVESEWFIDRF